MAKNEVYDVVYKALKGANVNLNLPDNELIYLATLVSTVATSSYDTRNYFYNEIYKLAIEITNNLSKQSEEAKKKLIELGLLKEEDQKEDKVEEEGKDKKKKILN
jgi:hypothetical protein